MNPQNQVNLERESLLAVLKNAYQLGETNTSLSAKQLIDEIVRQIKMGSKE